MSKNTIAITFVLALGLLSFAAAMTPFAYAQPLPDGSETDTEQEIKQKNVCSGWAVCTNIATGAIAP
jgi:hypothetical protein